MGNDAVGTAVSATSCTLAIKDVGLGAVDRLAFAGAWLVSEASKAEGPTLELASGRGWASAKVDVVSISGATDTLSSVCSESVGEGVTYASRVRVAVSVTVTYLGRR